MTTQYAVLPARSARTLTAKLFTLAAPDTVAFTADSVTERTNAKGEYVCTFGEASVISGDYKLVLFYGTLAAAIGFVTFAGTDAETATETPVIAELDSGSKDEIRSGLAMTTDVEQVGISVGTARSDVLSAISGLNNLSALANIYGSPLLEIPDSGSTDFAFTLVVRDNEGKLVALDASPSIEAKNAAGTDRSANLTTVSVPATGRYEFRYSVPANHAKESLRIRCSGTVSGEARFVEWGGAVVDYDTLTIQNAIKTKVDAIDQRLPSDPADQSQVEIYIDGAVASIQGSQQAAAAAALNAYDPPTNAEMEARTLPSASYATSTALTAVRTFVRKMFQLALRKDAAIAADNAAELTELNASGGSGVGGYLNTTDSQEATVDRGNVAWLTGGSGESATLMLSTTIATVTSQAVFVLAEGSPDNDAYNNQLIIVTDGTTDIQKSCSTVSDYVGLSRTLTLKTLPKFTIAVGDKVSVIAIGDGSGPAVNLFLGAAVPMTVGEVTGLSQGLVVGDSYTEAVGRRIPVSLVDVNGNAISTQFGSRSLSDNDCVIRILMHSETNENVVARAVGQCEFVAQSGQTPASLLVSIPHTETSKLSPGTHVVQFRAEWPDGENVTLAWRGSVSLKKRVYKK